MAGEPHPPSPLGGVGDGGDGALGLDEGPGIGAGVKDLPQDSSVAGTEFSCSHSFDQEHIYEVNDERGYLSNIISEKETHIDTVSRRKDM